MFDDEERKQSAEHEKHSRLRLGILRSCIMGDLAPYGEQFEKIVGIVEAAGERAYRKVNEELILCTAT